MQMSRKHNQLGVLLQDEVNRTMFRIALKRTCNERNIDYRTQYQRAIQTDVFKANLDEMVYVVRLAAKETFDI